MMIGLILNHSNLAVTQHSVYPFSGFAVHNSEVIGVRTAGVFRQDPAEPVSAYFEIYADMSARCRIRHIYIVGKFSGNMAVTVTSDDHISMNYVGIPTRINQNQHTFRVSVSRQNGIGRYWKLKIGNQDMSDFSIDEISAVPIYITHFRR